METISNLKPIPNQRFSVTKNDHVYDFHFFSCEEFMAYDLSIDQEEIATGYRMVYGYPLIPYQHLELGGNFVIDIVNGDYADYESFGDSQFLRYLTQEESDRWWEGLRSGAA